MSCWNYYTLGKPLTVVSRASTINNNNIEEGIHTIMTRLPTPGSDDGAWGTILNDYLAQSHNSDGTLKSGIISETNLDSATLTKLNSGGSGGGVASVNTRTGVVTLTKSDVNLTNVDNTADVDKPISTATQTALSTKYAKPVGGIPESDLASAVQSKLDNPPTPSLKLSALQDVTGTDAASTGQVLKFNGTDWEPGTDDGGTGGSDPVMGGDLSGTASTAQIVANAVGTAELADSAVTSAKIADGTITNADIATTATIAKSKLASLAITDSDVSTISQGKITGLAASLTAKVDTAKVGAANGVASLDGSGELPDAQLPAGVILYVKYSGSAWPSRPTSRTDIQVRWEAATSSDPDPTGYVAGVDYLERPAA